MISSYTIASNPTCIVNSYLFQSVFNDLGMCDVTLMGLTMTPPVEYLYRFGSVTAFGAYTHNPFSHHRTLVWGGGYNTENNNSPGLLEDRQ